MAVVRGCGPQSVLVVVSFVSYALAGLGGFSSDGAGNGQGALLRWGSDRGKSRSIGSEIRVWSQSVWVDVDDFLQVRGSMTERNLCLLSKSY